MNIWLTIGLIIIISAVSSFITYKIFYQKGFTKGVKTREHEILDEYCVYYPLNEIGNLAQELMEKDGLSPNFPIMLIMPDKYNYVEGVIPE